jgi:hypothetical protein
MIAGGDGPAPSMRPAILASLWGYLILFVAWNLATDPILCNYIQLAVPFTIPLLGAIGRSTLARRVSLWIAAGGTAMVTVLLLFSGLWLLVLPILVVYLWMAWTMNTWRRETSTM